MPTPLHAVLVAIGSHGDVHPFVGLGLRLKSRGHRVTVMTNGHFEPLIRQAGLEFCSTSTDEEFRKLIQDPDLWDTKKGFNAVVRSLHELTPRIFRLLEKFHKEDGDRLVVVGSTLALAAKQAYETFGIKFVTLHLAPSVFQSSYHMPRYPGMPLGQDAPRWMKRLTYFFINWVIDRNVSPVINPLRKELGLPKAKGLFNTWWNSPDLVLGMFPDWFGPMQPDWPKQTKVVGFPLYDEADLTPMSAELIKFLDEGPPPIAFTPGSAMAQGRAFFEASARACEILGKRGLLLTRHEEQIPPGLSAGVIHVDYAPFSQLLPRCAAVVHHGGIGTTAQALASACPQLIQPFSHDQPDNADRLIRLGVARSVPAKDYTAQSAAKALGDLLDSPTTLPNCVTLAQKIKGIDALGQAALLIEGLVTP